MAKKKSSKSSTDEIDEQGLQTAMDAPADAVAASEDVIDQAVEIEPEFEPEAQDVAAYEEPVEDYVEETGKSLSARLLTWLVLMLAGAGVALWGAPRIAPNLPQFAAPIKPYLMPGATQSESQIAELRTELTGELETVRTTAQTAAQAAEAAGDASAINERIASVESALDGRITTLGDQLAASDGSEIEGRLAALETEVEGLGAQLSQILSEVAGADGAGLSEEAIANLASNAAAIDGINAEIAALSTKQGALAQRIDEVEVASNRKLEEAQQSAAEVEREAIAMAAYEQLKVAIDTGKSFASPLATFGDNSDVSIPEPLLKAAPVGVATVEQLTAAFSPLSHEAIRASTRVTNEDNGAMGRIGSFLKSQVATRSLEPIEGDDANAVLSRIGAAVDNEDLATALAESDALPESAKAPLQGWLDQVKTRLDVTDAVASLTADRS